jgi:hypothetical protein
MIPWARTFSRCGNQTENAFVRFGKQPASPAPKRKRVTHMDAKLHIQPVAAVKNDHQRTMRISTLRGPSQSPNQPLGISKRAYARPNAAKIEPIWVFVSPRSREMTGAAWDIETRSM